MNPNARLSAIVTGGADGIGFAIGRRLGHDGFHVIIVDIDQEAGDAAASSLKADRISCEFMCHDVCDWSLTETLYNELPPADYDLAALVNNAAAKSGLGLFTETEAAWDANLSTSLKATFRFSQLFISRARGSGTAGSIVNVGSVASRLASAQSPAYHAAKAGVSGLTRYLAVNAGIHGTNVRVNCVDPGLIVQSRHHARYQAPENDGYRAAAETVQPLGQVGSEDDVANVVSWLCSSESSYISGGCIDVDGAASVQEQFTLLLRAGQPDLQRDPAMGRQSGSS